MRSRLADYRLLHPLEPGLARIPAWLAEPPDRLGQAGPVVVSELADLDDSGWALAASRLAALAAVRSPHLVLQLEAGRTDEEGTAVTWSSRSRGAAAAVDPAAGRGAVLAALADAALGAEALHQAGCVHGAITAATVLVDGGRGVLDVPPERAGMVGSLVATAGPSVVDLDGVEPDAIWGSGPTPATDVYALGACAHALLTGGRLLHPGLATDQPVTAVQRVLVERPSVDPELGGDLVGVIQACLAFDPADRPASAAEVAGRFRDLAGAAS